MDNKSQVLQKSQVLGSSQKKVSQVQGSNQVGKSQSQANLQGSQLFQSQFVTPEQLKVESMKGYLPRRFNVTDRIKPITYNQLKVLEEMEHQIDEIDSKYKKEDEKQKVQKERDLNQVQPSQQKVTKPNEFKTKPLRRLDSDFQMFKEIFVQPKEKILNSLKDKEKDFEELFHSGTQKQYDKILNIYNEEEEKGKGKTLAKYNDDEKTTRNPNLLTSTVDLNTDIQMKISSGNREISPEKQIEKIIQDNVHHLEQTLKLNSQQQLQANFFDQQIQVQPPDLPNATIASPLTPGNGYAPSVPLINSFKDNKSNIKDLLMRAKAGMQAGDIQKEAHLSYYLGMVYETNKNYQEAIKFYKKFFTCARMMEDKIGLALGANRIAVNYFNQGNYEKAIEYHKQNIQLSDLENTFAGFYNIGITYRKLKRYEESINSFKKALEWAKQREEIESECLAFGQLGVTMNYCQLYEDALDNFTNCFELSKKLKNTKLQLDCLISITKISALTPLKNSDKSIKIVKDAVTCATQLGDKKMASLCLCNLGVLEGGKQYETYQESMNLNNDIY